ncbi:hypothetical protein KKF38_04695 [Patescibacteria group bacterium]|nr:hypothetical protein [Patescibacteria group bacterium]
METTIIKQFGSGQITIPKKWRRDAKTTFYHARKRGESIILSPLDEKDDYGVEYYENKEGFGLRFPKGIPTGEFIKKWKRAEAILSKNNGKMA